MINLTDSATEKIRDLLAEENNPNLNLRIFVQGGGCAGMQYGFTFDEIENEDDFSVVNDTVRLLIDAMSMQYLQDATIDYKEDLMSSQFVIQNPNVETSCGCGSSFAPR